MAFVLVAVASGAILTAIVLGIKKPDSDIITICVDKIVDIILAGFVTYFLTQKNEDRKVIKEGAIQCLLESQRQFKELFDQNTNDITKAALRESIFELCLEAHKNLLKINLHSLADRVEEMGTRIGQMKSVQRSVTDADISVSDDITKIDHKFSQIILKIVGTP